jgi:hypothetical protein
VLIAALCRRGMRGHWIKVKFVAKPFDEIEGHFLGLPAVNQIFFVKADIIYRYAVNLLKTPINSLAPIGILHVDSHRGWRMERR